MKCKSILAVLLLLFIHYSCDDKFEDTPPQKYSDESSIYKSIELNTDNIIADIIDAKYLLVKNSNKNESFQLLEKITSEKNSPLEVSFSYDDKKNITTENTFLNIKKIHSINKNYLLIEGNFQFKLLSKIDIKYDIKTTTSIIKLDTTITQDTIHTDTIKSFITQSYSNIIINKNTGKLINYKISPDESSWLYDTSPFIHTDLNKNMYFIEKGAISAYKFSITQDKISNEKYIPDGQITTPLSYLIDSIGNFWFNTKFKKASGGIISLEKLKLDHDLYYNPHFFTAFGKTYAIGFRQDYNTSSDPELPWDLKTSSLIEIKFDSKKDEIVSKEIMTDSSYYIYSGIKGIKKIDDKLFFITYSKTTNIGWILEPDMDIRIVYLAQDFDNYTTPSECKYEGASLNYIYYKTPSALLRFNSNKLSSSFIPNERYTYDSELIGGYRLNNWNVVRFPEEIEVDNYTIESNDEILFTGLNLNTEEYVTGILYLDNSIELFKQSKNDKIILLKKLNR